MKVRLKIHQALAFALIAMIFGVAGWFLWPAGKISGKPTTVRKSRVVAADKDQVFGQFDRWLESYAKAVSPARPALTGSGLELARARRTRMEALIRDNPRKALQQAVTLDVWKSLPRALQSEVEEPFSALGDFKVLPVCPNGHETPSGKFPAVIRYAEFEGQPVLSSSVFGRREGLSTKEDAPIQGIRLGHLAALREEVFHELEPRETAVAEALYPIANPLPDRDFRTGEPLGAQPVVALAGGRVFKFSDHGSLESFEKSIAGLDTKPGPHGGAAVLFLPLPAAGAVGAFNLGGAILLNDTLGSAWTETKKKVLMIRCDFSDFPNSTSPVVGQSEYATLLNTTVSDDIRDFSYGKTWIEATVSADITRLPNLSTYYSAITDPDNLTSRNTELLADAKATFHANNPSVVLADYDIVGVWFVGIGMKSGGISYAGLAGGTDLWIQNSKDAAVHVHEFGHNYGIGHSSFWTPPVGSMDPVDPAGSNDEYGDPFDVMGKGTVPEGVYHAEAKQRLNWLSAGQWTDATASGTYRINRIDNANTTGVRGLRVTKAANEHYWLSFRKLFANSWLRAGANIVWERDDYGRSWLIDTTPASLAGGDDRTDGSIAIGRTYADAASNIYITPLARGGTSPNEYLDVRVNLGPFPANSAPTATLNGPSTLAARQTCIFTARASDPNGDELAYSWDFGQGFTFDNHNSASFSWNSGGTYTVKLTVSDMKGQSTLATKTVTVTDPLTTWAARTSGAAGDFNLLTASSTKVVAAGENYTTYKGPVATSADGVTWTSYPLGSNQQMSAGAWDGSKFLLAGMEPISFSPTVWVGCILTSPSANSGSWTKVVFTGSPLHGIAFGNGVSVAVGENGTIRRSTDGTNWSLVTSGTTSTLANVAYGGGKFVAVGYAGGNGTCTVLTSTDGSSWTNASAGAGVATWQDLRSIKWTNDRFLASGWYAKLRHSLDLGASFATTRSANDDTPALAYGNGVWFAAGVDDANTGSETDIDLVSTDGANWTPLATPSLDNRTAAIFFNNTFITAGKNHSIRQSGSVTNTNIGYLNWRENYYPDHGSLSAPNEDSDGDGLENLLEYALGASPVNGAGVNGVGALPQAALFSSPALLSDRIALQFSIPQPSPADLGYVVEVSGTLSSSWTPLATKTGTGAWTWNAGGTSRIVLATAAGGKIPVTVGDSQAATVAPARFLRLRTFVVQ